MCYNLVNDYSCWVFLYLSYIKCQVVIYVCIVIYVYQYIKVIICLTGKNMSVILLYLLIYFSVFFMIMELLTGKEYV